MSLSVEKKSSMPELAEGQEDNQFLTFSLKGEMFALGILRIKEILEYGLLTPVPMMPAFIKGVINLRGAVVPVIDLSVRFYGQRSEVHKRSCIVIVEVETDEGRQDIGVMVDSVSEVLEIAARDIEPSPAFGSRLRADFIDGMGKVQGEFVIILAIDKVLSIDELAVISQVAEQQPGRVAAVGGS